jgi:hypothetical protein
MEMQNKASRQYYLDNLKVFLTVLVIFHHAGQAYGTGGGWALPAIGVVSTVISFVFTWLVRMIPGVRKVL